MKHRKDGKRVKSLNGVNLMMAHFKPYRADSDVYINQKMDVTNLVKYYKKLKHDDENSNITYFHLFCTAMGKVVYNRPLLNRFIINKKFYDRNEVTISFVAKKEFTDTAEETLSVIRVKEDDNLNTLSAKLHGTVKDIRENKTNIADDLINYIGKLPKLLQSIVVGLIKFGDNHDLLPSSITENSIYHSTVLVSNLGSIKCGAIYHNLTDFGTNSIIITIGEIKDEPVVIDGKIEIRKMCEIGANLDERIADGLYFVKSLQLFEEILKQPELLLDNVNSIVKPN